VDAQVARPDSDRVIKVRGIEPGIALLLHVGTKLLQPLLGAPEAAWRHILDARVSEQSLERFGPRIAIDWIAVKVAQNHELGVARKPPRRAHIVDNPIGATRSQVVDPEADLIVVATAVAVFGAIKCRRGRVAAQRM